MVMVSPSTCANSTLVFSGKYCETSMAGPIVCTMHSEGSFTNVTAWGLPMDTQVNSRIDSPVLTGCSTTAGPNAVSVSFR